MTFPSLSDAVGGALGRLKGLLRQSFGLFLSGGKLISVNSLGVQGGTLDLSSNSLGGIAIVGSGSSLVFNSNGTNSLMVLNAGKDLSLASGSSIGFSSGSTVTNGSTSDTFFKRAAAGVFSCNSGSPASVAVGWLQLSAGSTRVGSNATNNTATLSSGVLTNLSQTLIAGRKYSGILMVPASNSTGAEGIQFDFNGGSATFTTIEFGFHGTAIGATLGGTTDSTAAATPINCTAVSTSTSWFMIPFSCVCNAGGTVIPRFAENTTSTGTATVNGTAFWLNFDMVN